jgi:hypothetical protein
MFFLKYRLTRSVVGFWFYNFLWSDPPLLPSSLPRPLPDMGHLPQAQLGQFLTISPNVSVSHIPRGFRSSSVYLVLHVDVRSH